MGYDLGKIGIRKQSPYIGYGSGQKLKINQIELVTSPSTGSMKAVLHMETPPVKEPGFEPVNGAKGKVGKIGCGVYMKHEKQKEEFLYKMTLIAEALGLGDEVKEIAGDSFEKVVSEIEKVITGGDKFANYTIFGEEYAKSNGTVGLRLMFPRWNFVEPLEVQESKLTVFNPNDPTHLKKIRRDESAGTYVDRSTGTIGDTYDAHDLPF
jgi:hypothetical protein